VGNDWPAPRQAFTASCAPAATRANGEPGRLQQQQSESPASVPAPKPRDTFSGIRELEDRYLRLRQDNLEEPVSHDAHESPDAVSGL
jgi:hypothetical protein